VQFPTPRGVLGLRRGVTRAVDQVSFTLDSGETLGIVGESGSGKSTLGRAVLALQPAVQGQVLLRGRDVLRLGSGDLRKARSEMQMIFQDPGGSLNPRRTVRQTVEEPMALHHPELSRSDRQRRTLELLDRCGILHAWSQRYPHELSGGQRQRVAIARALAPSPRLIVCDEPTSALDVSVQAQILNLLTDLQRDLGLAYLFISHDLGVVQHLSHRIAVMQAGRILECGPREQVLKSPAHAYTAKLLAAAGGGIEA